MIELTFFSVKFLLDVKLFVLGVYSQKKKLSGNFTKLIQNLHNINY